MIAKMLRIRRIRIRRMLRKIYWFLIIVRHILYVLRYRIKIIKGDQIIILINKEF